MLQKSKTDGGGTGPDALELLKEAAREWLSDNASRLSAPLAYYAVFSLAPLLVILISIIALVFGEEAAKGQIAGQISDWIGPQAAQTVENALAATSSSQKAGIVATVVGIAVLLFGASTFFSELQSTLNAIWGVKFRPGQPILQVLRERVLSFSLVLAIGFLLLVSLVVSALLAGFSKWLSAHVSLSAGVWSTLDILLSFAVTTVLFAMIFKTLPRVIQRWSDVFAGGALTASLFTGGKTAIAWYLGRSSVASAFGAAGSLVMILLWVYYANCVLLLGAEFTKVVGRRLRGGIRPRHDAIQVTPPETADSASG